MSKVWIIEQGSYSDYRVVGIYTTAENAQRICDRINQNEDYEKAEVSERELDPGIDALNQGLNKFFIVMAADGVLERCEESRSWDGYDIADGSTLRPWRRTTAPAWQGMEGIIDAVQGSIFARDVEHATKIVNEHRLVLLAEGTISNKRTPPPLPGLLPGHQP